MSDFQLLIRVMNLRQSRNRNPSQNQRRSPRNPRLLLQQSPPVLQKRRSWRRDAGRKRRALPPLRKTKKIQVCHSHRTTISSRVNFIYSSLGLYIPPIKRIIEYKWVYRCPWCEYTGCIVSQYHFWLKLIFSDCSRGSVFSTGMFSWAYLCCLVYMF